MKKKIIIIGAGISGLVCGNILAKKGHDVTIFESHILPGGYTAGFYRKGFYFESGTLSFEAISTINKMMSDLGLKGQVSFVRKYHRFVSPDFDEVLMSYDDFKKMVYRKFADEKDNLDRYFQTIDYLYNAFNFPIKNPNPFLYDRIDFIAKSIKFIPTLFKYRQINKRFGNKTLKEFTGEYFRPESKLCKLLGNLGYEDMCLEAFGGSLNFLDDYWSVFEGMQKWANILADNLKKNGGKINLNSKVEKILTKDKKAFGIISKGESYYADYIISASDLKKTFLDLIDDKTLIPQSMMDNISKSAVSDGAFTVYLGLDLPNEKLKEYMKTPYLFNFDKDYAENSTSIIDNDFFEKATEIIYSPSLVNESLSPKGKSSLMIQVIIPNKWTQIFRRMGQKEYLSKKEEFSKILIKRAENIIPMLSKSIIVKDSATPLTYERYTQNTDGSTSSWSWNPKKKFNKNLLEINVDTPIKNLFVSSCWSMQIGGVPGAITTAYKVSKKIK